MPSSRTRLPAWQKLVEHQRVFSALHLRELFAQDPARFRKFSLASCGLLVDWSKQRVTDETLRLLNALAHECDLESWVKRMFAGERVNSTENRAALHVALRANARIALDGRDATADARSVLAAMSRFVRGVHAGRIRGASGRKFTDVIHIGIGGSDLGPRLACEALAPYAKAQPRLHFVSNVDGTALTSVTGRLNPATTLVIIASKTFTTDETLANARSARAWLEKRLRGKAARHLCGVTAAPARAADFGVPAERVFRIWDWVGGRYSLWSAIGLPIALATGMARFDELRAGARAMDEHFAGAPAERNLPVVLGLIEIWNASFRGAASRVVVPYDERLRLLPAYLQQLEMESCGKHVTRGGSRVDYPTAPITWGSAGTDGQHAYFQWLHQGTQVATAEFIACCRPRHRLRAHHDLLIANCFAQAESLAFGTTGADAAALPLHRKLEGNRPSTCILLDELTPRALGALLALYEHKVFVQSVIWDVNAFDQWGVDLGKRLAGGILSEIGGAAPPAARDASTRGLIDHFRKQRRKS